ncbi:MAG: hypothetical protein OEM96_01645 [Gemmatimonadota bacterium]|nr:hypothetical protein [Gemmatimonadota bacterium]
MKSYQQLFAELKRRKVFQVAAVYGAVGFGVLQLADILVPVLLPYSAEAERRVMEIDAGVTGRSELAP